MGRKRGVRPRPTEFTESSNTDNTKSTESDSAPLLATASDIIRTTISTSTSGIGSSSTPSSNLGYSLASDTSPSSPSRDIPIPPDTFSDSINTNSKSRRLSHSTNTDSKTFAHSALQATFSGLLGRFISRYLVWILYLYTWLSSRVDSMAIGIGRWILGQTPPTTAGVPLEGVGAGKKVVRRRRKGSLGGSLEDGYYPGMVNLSGVLCYMNSVLSSLASVTSLIVHLERITILAVETDLPTPVTDALTDVFNELNTPHKSPPRPIRPHDLLAALHSLPQIRRLLGTREQQDAHELFVVLSEAVSDEALKVAREVVKLRGIADVLSLQAYCVDKGALQPDSPTSLSSPKSFLSAGRELVKEKQKKVRGLAQPWEGLMARRKACRRCGYHSEVRMDTMGGMELPLPLSGDTTLYSCIGEYLAPELLSGVTCEMCSLKATLEFYQSEASRLLLPPNKAHLNGHAKSSTASGSFSILENLPNVDTSGEISDKRKKKAKDAKKIEKRLQEMVDSNTVTHYGEPIPVPGQNDLIVKWQTFNADTVRECILTRPPQTLRLHLDRSGFTPYGQLVKKSARVDFPLVLDLTRFVAKGVWEERQGLTSTMVQSQLRPDPSRRVLYRLESAILHYGYTTHSGHFICIRRKPTKVDDRHKPVPVRKSCPDECRCEQCLFFGQVRGEQNVPGKGWLRVSDDEIEEVGAEALVDARAAVFMLFYERVGEYDEVRGERLKREEGGAGNIKGKL